MRPHEAKCLAEVRERELAVLSQLEQVEDDHEEGVG